MYSHMSMYTHTLLTHYLFKKKMVLLIAAQLFILHSLKARPLNRIPISAQKDLATFGQSPTDEFAVKIDYPLLGSTNVNVCGTIGATYLEAATLYTFELSMFSDFSASTTVTGIANNFYYSNLSYSQLYYVRVKTDLSSQWSEAISFTTGSLNELTFISFPDDMATKVNTDGTIGANYLCEGAVYTFELSVEPDFSDSSIVVNTSDPYFYYSNLAYAHQYYVRVKTNLAPVWSETITFTTGTLAELTFISYPENGSTGIEVNGQLEANWLQTCTYYLFQISKNPNFSGSKTEIKSLSPYTDYGQLEYGQLYYVRMKTDLSPQWSETVSFTTKSSDLEARKKGAETLTVPAHKEALTIFPNPAKHIFNVMFADPEEIHVVQLLDIYGKVVMQTNITGPLGEINVTGIQPGMYVVSSSSNGNIIRKKLQICK